MAFPHISLFVIVASMITAGVAGAFESDGYRTGMSIEQATSVARGNGYSLVNRKDGLWTVFETSLSTRHRLAFCDGHLIAYGKPLKDLAAFIRAVSQRTRDFGKGDYRASGYDGDRSSVLTLSISWKDGDETVVLEAEQWDASHYFMFLWSSQNPCASKTSN